MYVIRIEQIPEVEGKPLMSSLISVQNPEPELENLLRSLGIDFSLAGHYDNPL
jgi:hypothetical protein